MAHAAQAQQGATSPLLRLEIQARLAERAIAAGGFRFSTGEFDLRLPLTGEPEEIIGPTTR